MHARLLRLLLAHLVDHVAPQVIAGRAEVLPPVGQHLLDLAVLGAQPHEIEGRAKPRLLDHAQWRHAGAFVETRLHHPDLAHVAGQLAAARHVADTRIEHIVDGFLQGRERRLPGAPFHAFVPALAHVRPQHAGQQKTRRDRFAFAHAAVGVLQRGAHERHLRTFHHQIQQRVDALPQAEFLELRDSGQRVAGLQQLEHLVEQPALRHVGQQLLHGHQRRGGLRIEPEAQHPKLGREAHCADDAHRVLAVTRGGVADHAQREFLRVLDAAVVVHHHLRLRVVVHRVDGEVAPYRVFLLRAPDVVAQHPTAGIDRVFHAGQFAAAGAFVARNLFGGGVVHVGAKRRHLDHLVFASAPEHHVHDAKTPTDDEGAPEQALDLLRRRVGGDIEVFRTQADQQVAHRAAHDVSLETRGLERMHDIGRAFVHQLRIDAVFGSGDLLAFAEFRLGATYGLFLAGRSPAEQLVDEVFDHEVLGNRSSMRHPLRSAIARSSGSGLVATGVSACSSKGRSLVESE